MAVRKKAKSKTSKRGSRESTTKKPKRKTAPKKKTPKRTKGGRSTKPGTSRKAMTVDQVRDALVAEITKGKPLPGSPLPVSLFLSLYKPTPEGVIRAALSQLETAGYVVTQPNGDYAATGKT